MNAWHLTWCSWPILLVLLTIWLVIRIVYRTLQNANAACPHGDSELRPRSLIFNHFQHSDAASSAWGCRQIWHPLPPCCTTSCKNVTVFNTSAEQIKPQLVFLNLCGWTRVLLTDLSHFIMLQVAFFSERLEHNIGSWEATGLSQCSTQKSHMFLVLSPVIFPLKKSVSLVRSGGERTQRVIQVPLTMRKGT